MDDENGAPVEVRVLGPLALAIEGRPVSVSSPRQRSVLAMLALHAGRSVGTYELCAALWSEPLPPSARKTVQVYVSRLRRRIDDAGGSGADLLATTADGYALAVPADAVDAHRFEHLAARARTALDGGRAEDGAALLTEALGLWQGEPVPDLVDSPGGQAQVAPLVEMALDARELHNEAELALGHHNHLAGRLEAQIAESPLRERLWRQLMIALYRADRQADALRAYQRARAVLVDELGLEPGRELRQLEAAIVAQDRALDWSGPTGEGDAPAERPARPGQEARGRGERRPAAASHGAAGRRSGAALWAERLRDGSFVNRTDELQRLDGAFRSAGRGLSVVALSGQEGMGKSRVIAEAVHRFADKASLVLVAEGATGDAGTEAATLRRAVDRWARHADTARLDLPPRASATLAGLSPVLADLLEGTAPGALEVAPSVHALADALADLVRAAADDQSAALFLDDADRADATTLAVIRQLVQAHPDLELLLVLGSRDPGRRRELGELLADAHRLPGTESLVLTGLGADEGAELLADRMGRPDADEEHLALAALCQQAAGVPRHLVELARHLEGRLPSEVGTGVASGVDALGVPESLRAMVRGQAALLSDRDRSRLDLAAVIGVVFDTAVLARCADEEDSDITAWVDRAGAAGLVTDLEGGRAAFSSAVVRRAVYDDLPAGRRSTLHRQVGETMAGTTDTAPEGGIAGVVDQFALARIPGDARSESEEDTEQRYVAAYLDALREVGALGGEGEDAVPGADEARRRCELLWGLARSRRERGDLSAAYDLFARAAHDAEAAGLPDLFARSAADAAGVVADLGIYHPPVVALLRRAEAVLPDDDPVRSDVRSALVPELVWAGDWEAAVALSVEIAAGGVTG